MRGIVLVLHNITEIKKLEQIRKDFVANVSHELKTPVTSIKGFAETLIDGAMNEPSLREKFLTIILKESERLQSLIQDLLELSKIEQQYFQLNWTKANITEAVEEAVTLLKEKAQKKEVSLHFFSDGVLTIDGDAERLKQIAINLMTNAIVYTPAGGHIAVSLAEDGDWVTLQVSDSGIGITEEEIPRIFERFYRVDRARSRNSGGTGLGLAIVKHLVEAHHGRIEVDSEPGKGTTFTILSKKSRTE